MPMLEEITGIRVVLPNTADESLRVYIKTILRKAEPYAGSTVTIGGTKSLTVALEHVAGHYPDGSRKKREQATYRSFVQKQIDKYETGYNATAEGGPGSGRHATGRKEYIPHPRVAVDLKKHINKDGSLAEHTGKSGKLTEERQALHDKIIAEHLRAVSPVENPTATIMGGGTAAGKSSLMRDNNMSFPNTVRVDSDSIKGQLPEFGQMIAAGDKGAAAYVHEESSGLARDIVAGGLSSGRNTMLDGTGDSSIESLSNKIAGMRADGATRVVGEYVTCPTEDAIARADARGDKTGRYVYHDFIRNVHASVARVLPEAIKRGLFDEVRLWDTTGGGHVRATLVMEHKDGKTIIHDKGRWKTFLEKGK